MLVVVTAARNQLRHQLIGRIRQRARIETRRPHVGEPSQQRCRGVEAHRAADPLRLAAGIAQHDGDAFLRIRLGAQHRQPAREIGDAPHPLQIGDVAMVFLE